ELVSYVDEPDVFLVVSALTAYKDIVSITRSYQFLDQYKLLFTKLDEATTLGSILNMRTLTGKPLSYFTTGQSVPDDIEIANAEKIANIIMGE
ncbi:MAG TPA: flagellar biosynthesis protein FlhF, partial [Clostridiales bacterium]|nr:flagellar biosynthesis protein FlhF [Clostridiales bacterium]